MKIITLLWLIIMAAAPASAGPGDCPDETLYRNFTAEGVVKEHGSADGFYLDIDLTPMSTGGETILTLSVQDTANTEAIRPLDPGDLVRVTYDLVREYNETDGECLIYAVLRSVESPRPPAPDKPRFD